MRVIAFATVFAVAVAASTAGAQNLLNNPSFESPAFNPAYPPLVATGWFTNDPANMFIDNSSSFVTDGTQYQQTGGSLEQNTGIAVIPGGTYHLQFDYVSFTDDPSGPPFVQLYTNPNADNDPLDDGNVQLFSQELPTGPISTVMPQSFDIVAPGDATGFVYFRFLTGQNYRGLDNVRLTVLPTDADFDNNGTVDGADFLAWQRGLGLTGASATNAAGDADGDMDVDKDDLAVWTSHFGMTSGIAAATAVPEPTAWTLLGLSSLAMGAIRRQTARRR
jgi:hypothetical protein